MPNTYVNKVQLADNTVLLDVSGTTAVASDVASGKTFTLATGETATGTGTIAPVTVPERDVNFYDYDGTIVYSYTVTDFLALTAMPANPDHSTDDIPLTSQGWNWTLADAKDYLQNSCTAPHQFLEIGQCYTPTDGKSHFIIELTGENDLSITAQFNSANGGLTVYWGDGSTSTQSSTASSFSISHTYSAKGIYHVKLEGNTSGGTYPFRSNATNFKKAIKKAFLTNKLTFVNSGTFEYCYQLEYITLPIDATVTINASNQYMFGYCSSLKHITLPPTMDAIGQLMFEYCSKLKSISIAKTTATGTSAKIYPSAFIYCVSLEIVTIPDTIIYIGDASSSDTTARYSFAYCYKLRKLVIPSSVKILSPNSFTYCYSLKEVILPTSITHILNNAFRYSYNLIWVWSKKTTAPTLGTNVFSSPNKIYVASSSYTSATNWSDYASIMEVGSPV